jgi:hypothetical protein
MTPGDEWNFTDPRVTHQPKRAEVGSFHGATTVTTASRMEMIIFPPLREKAKSVFLHDGLFELTVFGFHGHRGLT